MAKYELPVTFAGQAKIAASSVLSPQEAKRLDPSSQFALISAREAWADAGEPEVEPERLAVDFATGIGGVQTYWTPGALFKSAVQDAYYP